MIGGGFIGERLNHGPTERLGAHATRNRTTQGAAASVGEGVLLILASERDRVNVADAKAPFEDSSSARHERRLTGLRPVDLKQAVA